MTVERDDVVLLIERCANVYPRYECTVYEKEQKKTCRPIWSVISAFTLFRMAMQKLNNEKYSRSEDNNGNNSFGFPVSLPHAHILLSSLLCIKRKNCDRLGLLWGFLIVFQPHSAKHTPFPISFGFIVLPRLRLFHNSYLFIIRWKRLSTSKKFFN